MEGDILDREKLDLVLRNPIKAVIHFAGLKAVGESVAQPLFVRSNIRDHELVLSLLAEHHPRAVVNFPAESRPQHPRPE